MNPTPPKPSLSPRPLRGQDGSLRDKILVMLPPKPTDAPSQATSDLAPAEARALDAVAPIPAQATRVSSQPNETPSVIQPAVIPSALEQSSTVSVPPEPKKTAFEPSGSRPKRIAIAGNPNSGKSTLFNALTGMRQKVGNYPGVTVEKKEGVFYGSHGESMQLLDLPGCYSLQARSPDEAVSRDVLLGRQADTPRPDAIIAVVDATNLERNLYLVSQLLELEIPVILGLSMVDLAEKAGIVVDCNALSDLIGVPVQPIVAATGKGLLELKQWLSQAQLPLPSTRTPIPEALQCEIQQLRSLLHEHSAQFAEATLLLGSTPQELDALPSPLKTAVESAQIRLENTGIDPISAPVEARYEWLAPICALTVRKPGDPALNFTDRLDTVLTHPFWGWAAFLAAMALMFFSIFTLARIPMEWISSAQEALANWLQTVLPEGNFRSLVIDGGLAGVAGVLVFLPQILILTLFLGILEDSGYMARAAFLMDRLMARVGLHGKSFIPMLSSFACAIPGIMAARTIEQRKDRLVTILVSPLMSCSARLPVYTLLIAVLLPEVAMWKKSLIMLSMYLIGIAAAFLMAWLFKKTLLRSETPTLLMEMPPYRRPNLQSLILRMQDRAMVFLKRAGTVILALSVLLWALTKYPQPPNPEATGSEKIAYSIAGRVGRAIEPVIAPLGFDWKIGIGLIGSFAAREVFVSTMGIVYSVESSDDKARISALSDTMREQRRPDGTPVYTPLTATALMVFYVLAMQCFSTLAVVRRETNSWKWPTFQFAYMSVLAYLASLLITQGGRLLGWH
ncbi:MAG: ferrous iron transport protein B [Verrucomicrobiota bacterium]